MSGTPIRRGGARGLAVDVGTALAVGALVGLAPLAAGRPTLRRGGGQARDPLDISSRGWRRILGRTVAEFNEDQIPAVAASVTFFALLALFPALAAIVSIYGLFADVGDVRAQVLALEGLLPGGAITVIGDQMTRLAATDHGRLGLTFVVSLAISLWSANAGIKALIAGLNVAYEAREQRNFVSLNLRSLSFTAGATLFVVASVAILVTAPREFDRLGLSWLEAAAILRWPALFVAATGLLSVVYKYGPCRSHARWRWITPGGVTAALGWLAMSALFSWYVSNFGHYNATYGSLGAVVGFMTWIWLSLIVVLFGAELNSQIEREAATTGRRPRSRSAPG